MNDDINIWRFQIQLSRRLLFWAAGSVVLGLALIGFTSDFWAGFGIQSLAWGAIDGLIALAGLWMIKRRRSGDAQDPERMESRSRKLKRVLWINTGLDLLYIGAGIALAVTLGSGNPAWRGHGWGIIVQGTFLLFFDLIHAQSVPPGQLSPPLKAFSDPLHQPFFFGGGNAAALLVHGFPGTPAEMRPLAESLQKEGWTVQGILLPGFGSQFGDILTRGYREWLQAVVDALENLKRTHSPVLLVGYSLGGALALAACSLVQPDGLVLLSPFWRLGTATQRLMGRILRPFLPRYFRPLQKLDLSDPKLQQSLGQFFPDIDPSDPETQTWLRELQVPISVIYQILKTGRQGYGKTGSVEAPTLIVQGSEDELVRPLNTQRLVERLSAASRSTPPRYLEVSGGHNIIDNHEPGWDSLEQGILDFTRTLRKDERIRA